MMEDEKDLLAKWKVIYTSSRQEKKVSSYLEKYNIQHYLPLYKSLRFWKDRKKWVEMPLFNGYVFVKPTELQRDRVLQVPGVVKYLRYNGADAVIPENQINLIQELIEYGYSISEYSHDQKLETGDVAEILGGPLQGKEAEIVKIGDDAFIMVTIEAMNQSVMVKLPKEILKLRRKKPKEEFKPLW